MTESTIYSIAFILIGMLPIAASLANWNYFFEHRKAKFFVNLVGRKGARIFYGILGIGFLMIGGLSMAGIINLG